MPHVRPLAKHQAPEAAKPLLEAIEEKFGRSLNLFGTLAHQPDVASGLAKINDGIHEDLPDRFRELAYLKASTINGCEYCGHYHTKAAKKTGVTDGQIAALDDFAGSDAFDDQDKAVLAYADQLTRTAKVDADVVRKLKDFLDDRQLVTLAATVALANFTNRVNHGLDIDLP